MVRRLAERALGGAPATRVGVRTRRSGVEEEYVHGVLELALRLGEAMLSLGAAAADVLAAIRRTVDSFDLVDCQVDLTFTAITVSYDGGAHGRPVTLLRVVQSRVPDYGRLGAVMAVARETAAPSDLDPHRRLEEAHARLDAIVEAPHAYRRWFVTAALSTMAAAVAVLLGGGVTVTVIAGVTTALIDRTVWALDRRGLPPFFLQGVGAAIATLVAVGLFLVAPHLPFELVDVPPSLVVASGIVVLLAGLSLVGSAEDAISGFPITAGARAFEVVVLTLGIVVGIGGVLDVARRLGVPLEVVDVPPSGSPAWVRGVAAAVVAVAWALASYARWRAALVAGFVGALGWTVFTLVAGLGVGPAVASAAAALVVGVVSESQSHRWGIPSVVTSVCGIVPLLPGLMIYRALFTLVNDTEGGLAAGASGLLGAAMIGLGLAAGVTLGEFLAAPLRLGTRGTSRRVLTALRGERGEVSRPLEEEDATPTEPADPTAESPS